MPLFSHRVLLAPAAVLVGTAPAAAQVADSAHAHTLTIGPPVAARTIAMFPHPADPPPLPPIRAPGAPRLPATAAAPRLTLAARDETSVGRAVLLSALVPGLGQRALGAERWPVYVALEAWAWIRYIGLHGDARRLEHGYRDLAWEVARRVGVGERREGDFEYYESMEHFRASGAFDADPELAGLQPEGDLATFNGQIWSLAVGLYGSGRGTVPGTPGYDAALAYYEAKAVQPAFAWDWGDNDLEQQIFQSLIARSDEAYRSSRTTLGVILANHIVSAVDAFAIARLRAATGADIHLGPAPAGAGGLPRVGFSLTFPLPTR